MIRNVNANESGRITKLKMVETILLSFFNNKILEKITNYDTFQESK